MKHLQVEFTQSIAHNLYYIIYIFWEIGLIVQLPNAHCALFFTTIELNKHNSFSIHKSFNKEYCKMNYDTYNVKR